METPPEPVAEVVVEAPVPRESARSVPSAPPQVARARRLRPLHVVAWAAAVAIVVACWFVFSSGQPSTAADSRQADTTAPVEEAPRTGE
jgi:hypothetical protein